jgi:hypothetical protein
MKKTNRHISEKDFQRYLNNQMTDAERNVFERELQRQPFEAEALEGFEQISTHDLNTDLQEIKKEIIPRKQNKRIQYWAAAATFLLIITSGILLYQLRNETPIPTVTENKSVSKEDTTIDPKINSFQTNNAESEMIPITSEKEVPSAQELEIKPTDKSDVVEEIPKPKAEKSTLILQEKSKDTIFNNTKLADISGLMTPKAKNIYDREFEDFIDSQKNTTEVKFINQSVQNIEINRKRDTEHISQIITNNNIVNVSVVSGEDEKSFDTVRLINPDFAKMEFNPALYPSDTSVLSGRISDLSNLKQITNVGEPVINKAVSGVLKVEMNANLFPKGGMETFEKYLEDKALLPDSYKKKRAVVKMMIDFNEFGTITGFTNQNKADSALFEQAKKIVTEGPIWSPEIKNGRPVTTEKELKIVFRKK